MWFVLDLAVLVSCQQFDMIAVPQPPAGAEKADAPGHDELRRVRFKVRPARVPKMRLQVV